MLNIAATAWKGELNGVGARPQETRSTGKSQSRCQSEIWTFIMYCMVFPTVFLLRDRIGWVWYCNIHKFPLYKWERCRVLFYPHMLLLTWITPNGGRGLFTLDLLNCDRVVLGPIPSTQDDLRSIAARLQSAEHRGKPLVDILRSA